MTISYAARWALTGVTAVILVTLLACGGDATSDSGEASGGPGAIFPVTVYKSPEPSNYCGTRIGTCMIPAQAKGLACYCATPYGPAYGKAI